MDQTATLLTAEDLWRLPEGEGKRELVRGEVIEMSPVGFLHGAIAGKLIGLLRVWVEQHGAGGVVAPEIGFVLARNPDTVRAPDVAYIAAARIPPGDPSTKYWETAPDLAVEVVSPSDSAEELNEKVQLYLAAGTPLVWVISPRTRSVTAYLPDGEARVYRQDDVLEQDEVLPGFHCPVADLFDVTR
jgi:Uma2 family endonuclease